jgi:FdhD protein
VAELTDALRMPRDKVKAVGLTSDAVMKALKALPSHQPMNAANHTVHAAAFVTAAGDILLAREDVGRHNALDKLIGAMARKAQVPDDGFVLMSSRCSSELVQKCARVSLGALATMSAPTAFALQLAKQAGITLAARAPQGVMMFGA